MTTKVQSAQMPRTVGIARLLEEVRKGDLEAEEQRLSRVYDEPRALAASMMAHEALGHTLQLTALVDGTWVRVFGHAKPHCPEHENSQ